VDGGVDSGERGGNQSGRGAEKAGTVTQVAGSA